MYCWVSFYLFFFFSFLLTLFSCAQKSVAESSPASFGWKQMWHTVSRLATSRALCRPACYLLHFLLARKLVEYKDVVEGATAMLVMTEISAPAMLCDSSLFLMRHLLHVRNTEGSGGNVNASQNVVRWLFSKWNPGRTSLCSLIKITNRLQLRSLSPLVLLLMYIRLMFSIYSELHLTFLGLSNLQIRPRLVEQFVKLGSVIERTRRHYVIFYF